MNNSNNSNIFEQINNLNESLIALAKELAPRGRDQELIKLIKMVLVQARKEELVLMKSISHGDLVTKVGEILGIEPNPVNIRYFSNGNFCYEYENSVRGSEVYLMEIQEPWASAERQSHVKDILLHGIDAVKRGDAARIIAANPYWWEGRGDKKDRQHISVGGPLFYHLMKAAGVTKFISFDVHNEAYTGMAPELNHLTAIYDFSAIIIERIAHDKSGIPHAIWVADKDKERAVRLAELCGLTHDDAHMIDKIRREDVIDGKALQGQIIPGQTVHVVDDEGGSLKTFLNACTRLIEAGAGRVYGYLTYFFTNDEHLPDIQKIFSENPKLKIEELLYTDGIPAPRFDFNLLPFPCRQISIAPTLAGAIKAIHYHHTLEKYFKYERK